MDTTQIVAALTAGITLKVEMRKSEYGTPRPTLAVRAPKGTHWRKVGALHLIAAIVEAETPARERWLAQIGSRPDGSVYLELLEGTEEEAQRGIEFLAGLAERLAPPA